MKISGEVAKIHMRTDAKNLVTTARTIHLPEQKETIHMISTLIKEACSGSIHDLAPILTQNCLADCLTKASAKADNLITAVKNGKLLEVDIHPNSRPLMEHEAFLSTWCRTVRPTKKKDVFFLNTVKVSVAPTQQERPFHVMLVRKQHTQESRNYDLESEKRTFEKDGQNATKITSALADTNIRFFTPVTSSFVEILCAYLFLVTIFLTV